MISGDRASTTSYGKVTVNIQGAINVQRETLGMVNSLGLHKGREN